MTIVMCCNGCSEAFIICNKENRLYRMIQPIFFDYRLSIRDEFTFVLSGGAASGKLLYVMITFFEDDLTGR